MVNYLVSSFSMSWIKSDAILSIKHVTVNDIPKEIYPFRLLPDNLKYAKEILGVDIAELIKEKSLRVINVQSGDVFYIVHCSPKRDLTLEGYRDSYSVMKIEVFYED